jgi:processive 1,2-diacylglycerol beta-glucosyltransferase
VRRRILIVSASMGAGHDGAAKELRSRLEAAGHEGRIIDFLDAAPFGIGRFLRWTYEVQLRLAPWSYELTYRLWYLLPFLWAPVVAFDSWLTRRSLQRDIEELHPDVVVSTYCLSSLVLGRMRKKGWLRVPVVTYLTDFAVHPLWVHPSVDLHVAVSPWAAKTARERSHGGEARAPGPLVSRRFTGGLPDRAASRAALGLGPVERAVLVVAGSWGVGDVVSTVETLAGSGRYRPVAVCGRDEKLKRTLDERGVGIVIGWTSEMPALMSACDAVVENAGGLTCMESFAAGLPVVSYHPIPGHGRENAQFMADAGVSRYAHGESELFAALDEITTPGDARDQQIAMGKALFAGDVSLEVLELADRAAEQPVVVPFRLPRTPRVARRVAAAAVLTYAGLTVGAQAVSALGVGVARPPRNSVGQAYVGVRVDASEAADPALAGELAAMHITAIVDGQTARAHPDSVKRLAAAGVDIGNGGWGHGRRLRWDRAQADVARSGDLIRNQTGVKVREFAPCRRLDAFDQAWSHRRKQRLVLADHVFKPERVPGDVKSARVYVLDGRGRSRTALQTGLASLERRLQGAGLTPAPLASLR